MAVPRNLPPARVALSAVVLLLASAPAPACAQSPVWMSDTELSRAFAGTEITGTYKNGRTFNERYDKAGTLAYTEHEPHRLLTGTWSVVRGLFCTIYDSAGTGGCFRVHRVSANCFEFYFETRTEEEARDMIAPRPRSWTARAWRIDQPPTCDADPSV